MAMTRPLRWALWLLAVGLLTKIWLSGFLPLLGDEAFYWWEAQRLAPAYDDVPLATPALIALGSWIGGDHPAAVRAPFLLISLLSLGLLWQLARRVQDAATAGWTLLLAACLPLWAFNGLLAVPDVPLNLAILICLLAIVRWLQGERGPAGGWLIAGLALGWLSHYRFVLALAAAGLWLLLSADGRGLLRDRRFWACGVLGCALGLAPLLYQQWQHDWAGLRFQFSERHQGQWQLLPLADPLLQALISNPLLFGLLLWAGLRGWRQSERARELGAMAGFGLLMLIMLWLLGPFTDSERARLHWPLPGLLALCLPLAAQFAAGQLRPLWGRAVLLISSLMWVAVSLGLLLLAHAPQRLASSALYHHNLAGWDDAAALLRAHFPAAAAPQQVVADNFMLAAELQFLLGAEAELYALDHPLNHKHGRAGELRAMRRDSASLPPLAAGAVRWIIAEETASRLRQRPGWFAALCRQFPHAELVADQLVDAGRKRLLLWREQQGATVQCLPPALGYLESPRWNQVLRGAVDVSGWVLRGRVGISSVRLLIADRSLPLRYGLAIPSLLQQIDDPQDPSQPALGFAGELPADLPPGTHWMRLQVRSDGSDWQDVLAQPVQVAAR